MYLQSFGTIVKWPEDERRSGFLAFHTNQSSHPPPTLLLLRLWGELWIGAFGGPQATLQNLPDSLTREEASNRLMPVKERKVRMSIDTGMVVVIFISLMYMVLVFGLLFYVKNDWCDLLFKNFTVPKIAINKTMHKCMVSLVSFNFFLWIYTFWKKKYTNPISKGKSGLSTTLLFKGKWTQFLKLCTKKRKKKSLVFPFWLFPLNQGSQRILSLSLIGDSQSRFTASVLRNQKLAEAQRTQAIESET